MRAEDASIDVRLVDHHELQPSDELVPRAVVRQDAQVQHVRVGHQQSRPAANVGAVLGRSVAVEESMADVCVAWD